MGADKPLLLLDVDGPLNPFRARWFRRPRGYTTHRMKPPGYVARRAPVPPEQVKPLRVLLKRGHGPILTALPYEVVWATSWMHDTNDLIGPVLGLPQLQVIEWPQLFVPEIDGLFWKAQHILEWARGRPFAWVDDGITAKEQRFMAVHHDGPALLLPVDPRRGLSANDFDTLERWAAEVADGHG